MKKILNNKPYIYSLLISLIMLLFTSTNSFFYAFNEWPDINSYMTIGKSMLYNVVPYKDLFEQKGLILYVIYGIGYLIQHDNFHGLFLLEVISFSIFLYYNYKISRFYLNKNSSFIAITIISLITTTSASFSKGGSCEEFILPLMTIALYLLLKHFKEKPLSNKELIQLGFLFGTVFMMKYNLLGLWIGITFIIFLSYIKSNKTKSILNFLKYFTLGAAIPTLLSIIYLLLNGALKDFIDCYFIFNLKLYKNKVPLTSSIKDLLKGISETLIKNIPILFLLLYLPFSLKKEYNKMLRISIPLLTIFILIPIYIGHRYYIYYFLPVTTLLVFPIANLISQVENIYKFKFVFLVTIMLCIFLSFYYSNSKENLFLQRNDYPQYKFAKYIEKYNAPTLLNMSTLDNGFYTTTNIIPNTKFFHVLNIEYALFPNMLDEMHEYIRNKKVKFVIYNSHMSIEELKKIETTLFSNYEVVLSDKRGFEDNGERATVYLLKLKGLEEKNDKKSIIK